MNQITTITEAARPAHFADISGIIDLGKMCFAQSGLEGMSVVDDAAAEFMIGVIERQRSCPSAFDLAAFVTGPKGEPTGIIVGVIQPIYMVLSELAVSDLMWFVHPEKAKPTEGMSLLNALHQWADNCDSGPPLRQHMTNAIAGDADKLGRMFRRNGYTKMGEVFWKGYSR